MKIDSATAFHEAGHIAGRALLSDEPLDNFAEGSNEYKERIWAGVLQLLCGATAEEIATGSLLLEGCKTDVFRAWRMIGYLAGSIEDPAFGALRKQAENEAEEFLKTHWPFVEHVAELLMEGDWDDEAMAAMCPRGQC